MIKSKGLTLIELLIVMVILSILIPMPYIAFKGLQNEANRTKAMGDIKVIQLACESYYKNHYSQYPPVNNYQTALIVAVPQIFDRMLYDPFGATSTSTYIYKLSTDDPATAKYFIVYSLGPQKDGSASVDINGAVTATNEVVWGSNGHL